MGCFSYICKNCGESIKEDEGVKLFLLQEGKVLEEMEDNYTLYGNVNKHKWKNDWGKVLSLHFNNHDDDGIAAIHSDCWDGKVPSTISEDDPKQGCGNITTSKTKKNSYTFYSLIVDGERKIEDNRKMNELNNALTDLIDRGKKLLEELRKESGNKDHR